MRQITENDVPLKMIKFFYPLILFLMLNFGILLNVSLEAQISNEIKSLKENLNQVHLGTFDTSTDFTQVAKQVIPTVVSIYSTKIIRTSDLWLKNNHDEDLNDLLGEDYLNFSFPREFKQKGSGSGIIVSEKGYILTNLHVVENAESIDVKLSDNRTYQARLVGADPLTELAVVKIEETVQPARLGNSDSVTIGEWVLAFGNPLELSSTVTAGIVSAIGREIDIIDDNFGVENFIQTDATINPGSSGGALVNLKGEVIGVNTAIATQSGYSQGYGFAIPINLAKQIMDDLINKGYVVRSYLGVAMQDVDEKIARALNLEKPFGVFIDFVYQDGPAYRAGLWEKDVLISIDDQLVNQGNIVQSIIAQKKPGDAITLTIVRDNEVYEKRLILGEKYSTKIEQPSSISKIKSPGFGLKVENISRRMADEFGLEYSSGVIVTEVDRFSPADEVKIQPNDVILKINDRDVTSLYVFNKIISNLQSGKVYILKIKRQNNIFHRFLEAQ